METIPHRDFHSFIDEAKKISEWRLISWSLRFNRNMRGMQNKPAWPQ